MVSAAVGCGGGQSGTEGDLPPAPCAESDILIHGHIEELGVSCVELEVDEVHQDPSAAKLRIVQEMLERLGIGWEETAFVGDDLPDLAILRRVGLPAVVGNATAEARACAAWTATRDGGRGAVREFAEALLTARGEWAGRVEAYVRDREAGL